MEVVESTRAGHSDCARSSSHQSLGLQMSSRYRRPTGISLDQLMHLESPTEAGMLAYALTHNKNRSLKIPCDESKGLDESIRLRCEDMQGRLKTTLLAELASSRLLEISSCENLTKFVFVRTILVSQKVLRVEKD